MTRAVQRIVWVYERQGGAAKLVLSQAKEKRKYFQGDDVGRQIPTIEKLQILYISRCHFWG